MPLERGTENTQRFEICLHFEYNKCMYAVHISMLHFVINALRDT